MTPEQLTLGAVRATDPSTSREAAAKQTRSSVPAAILTVLLRGGRTDDEIAAALSEFHAPTVKSARSQLLKKGRIVWTGQERPGRQTGSTQRVWGLPR